MLEGWTEEALEAFKAIGIAAHTLPPYVLRVEPADEQTRPVDTSLELTDEEAELILPLLPAEPRQSGSVTNRTVIDALLWARQSGKRLTQLPPRFGRSSEAVRKRAERWSLADGWNRLHDELETLKLNDRRRLQLRALCVEQVRRGERIRRERSAAGR